MNFEEVKDLKVLLKKLLDHLDNIQLEGRMETTLDSIRKSVVKLAYVHKDAFTIREVSDRTGIPVKTLYRYQKQGILKTIDKPGMKTLVSHEGILNFLSHLEKN